MNPPLKPCFVICPIGEEGSEIRKRSDQVFKHIIIPAVHQLGYEATRADKMSEPGLITTQIIQHIVDDPLVVADLTGSNPNVFYELALRHAVRKPLVQLIRKGDKIPFDVGGMRTISIDLTDPDNVEQSRDEIVRQIQSVQDKAPRDIDSPISVALEIQTLRQSDKPEDRSLAQVLSAIGDLRQSIQGIEEKIQQVSIPSFLDIANSEYMSGRVYPRTVRTSFMLADEARKAEESFRNRANEVAKMVIEAQNLKRSDSPQDRAQGEALFENAISILNELTRGLPKE